MIGGMDKREWEKTGFKRKKKKIEINVQLLSKQECKGMENLGCEKKGWCIICMVIDKMEHHEINVEYFLSKEKAA